MTKGMNAFDDKKKRAIRRRNHVARDLAERKYHQRRVENKRREYNEDDYWTDAD